MTGTKGRALSLALSYALATSTPSVGAQELTAGATTTGLFNRATFEKAIEVVTEDPALSGLGVEPQGGASAVFDWSRVRQLAPGTELAVTARRPAPIRGHFLAADDSELQVSNGSVVHIARTDIAEVRTLRTRDFNGVANSSSFKWGIVIGVAGGVATAGFALHSYCKTNTCDTAPAVAIPIYAMLGFLVGGGIGALVAIGNKIETVVYRAPQATVGEK